MKIHPFAAMDKSRNMYGCTRCPNCGGHHRCVFADKPKVNDCGDCSHEEPTNEDNYSYHTE